MLTAIVTRLVLPGRLPAGVRPQAARGTV